MCETSLDEDYPILKGTLNDGRSYENKMGALLYLRAVKLMQGDQCLLAAAEKTEAAPAPAPALRLGLNVAWAGKFDDVVLQLAGAGGGGRPPLLLLVQLKHRLRRAVTRGELAGSCKNFAVHKYFESFRQVAPAADARCVLYTNAHVELRGAARDPVMESVFAQLLNTGGASGRMAQLDEVADAAICEPFADQPEAQGFLRSFFVCSQQAREDELDELLQQELAQLFGRLLPEAGAVSRRLVASVEALARAPAGRVPFLTETWTPWRDAVAAVAACHGPLARARLAPATATALAAPILDARTALLEMPGADARLRSAVLLQLGAALAASQGEPPLVASAALLAADAGDAAAPPPKTALDLWSGGRHCLLLVDAESESQHSSSDGEPEAELARRLARLLREDGARRLLVAAPGGDYALAAALRRSLTSRELRSTRLTLSLEHLDDDARDALLRTAVVFQGLPLALGELCGARALSRWLPAEELCALLGAAWAPTRVGAAPPAECAHFLERRCEARVRLRRELFLRDDLPDGVLVQGLGGDELLAVYGRPRAGAWAAASASDPRFSASRSVCESDWKEFCERHPNRPSHWVSYETGGHFRWLRSHGSAQALTEFAVEDSDSMDGLRWILQLGTASPDIDDLLQLWLSNLQQEERPKWKAEESARDAPPALVLEAGPGAGKSAFLRRAARRARQLFPRCWALLLDLSAATASLAAGADWETLVRAETDASVPVHSPAAAATATANPPRGRCPRFEDALRRHAPMLALIDAFDEVCPDYSGAALAVLRALRARPRCAVWVATRPSARARLDAALGACCQVTLLPLSAGQQRELLARLAPAPAPQLEEAVEALAAGGPARDDASDGDRETGGVLGAPLHVELLAETLQGGAQGAAGAGTAGPEGDARKSPRLVDLVEQLLQRKFEVYCCAKLRKDLTYPAVRQEMEHTLRPLFLEEHGLAALSAVLGRDEQAAVGLPAHEARLRTFLEKVARGEERTGVLLGVGPSGPRFAHRTLADYLAARWLCARPAAARPLLGVAEHQSLRAFLDALLARGRPLHEAVLARAPLAELQRLLAEDPARVAQVDEGGRTALHLAAQVSWAVAQLLSAGAELEAEDALLGSTALHYAALAEHWAEVRLLLAAGARVRQDAGAARCVRAVLRAAARAWPAAPPPETASAPAPSWPVLRVAAAAGAVHTTALHVAGALGHDAKVRRLLELGASAGARDEAGETPLHAAGRAGRPTAVALLLSAGAPPDARNAAGETPLAAAARAVADAAVDASVFRQARCRRAAQVLLRMGARADIADLRGNTPLHWSARAGDWRLVIYLLRAQAQRNAVNADNHTPLHLASLEGHLETVSVLLAGGRARPLARVWACMLPPSCLPQCAVAPPPPPPRRRLKKTVRRGMLFSFKFTASSGQHRTAAVSVLTDMYEETALAQRDSPLHLAAQGGHAALVSALLGAGADPNWVGVRGSTALHQASVQGHVAAMKVLLAGGADPDAADAFGERPLHKAAFANCAEAVALLAQAHARLDAQAADAAGGGRPLHTAARRGAVAATCALLGAGASIEAPDRAGETALHAAVRAARLETATALLAEGASASARSLSGATPLHCAVDASDASLALLLLRAGADACARDADGRSPLQRARDHAARLSHDATLLWRRNSAQLLRLLEAAAAERAEEVRGAVGGGGGDDAS